MISYPMMFDIALTFDHFSSPFYIVWFWILYTGGPKKRLLAVLQDGAGTAGGKALRIAAHKSLFAVWAVG